MTGLSGVANLLPISVVTQAARSAAHHIDFATSNLRGAPIPLYCAGAKVLATVAMGPVAGTGANITAMSYDGAFDMGIFVDPEAITDPTAFAANVAASFADLIAAGSAAQQLATKKKSAQEEVGNQEDGGQEKVNNELTRKRGQARRDLQLRLSLVTTAVVNFSNVTSCCSFHSGARLIQGRVRQVTTARCRRRCVPMLRGRWQDEAVGHVLPRNDARSRPNAQGLDPAMAEPGGRGGRSVCVLPGLKRRATGR